MIEETDSQSSSSSPSTTSTSSSTTSSPSRTNPATRPTSRPPVVPTAVANSLPPCRVCGEKASGFHYGVNTCEACKGFFRRSLQRKDKYKCLASGRCKIGQGRRSTCPSCRYEKCISVGMSKTAIKTGRYTHEKRTQDILEVKHLEQQELTQDHNHNITIISISPDRDESASMPQAATTATATTSTTVTRSKARGRGVARSTKSRGNPNPEETQLSTPSQVPGLSITSYPSVTILTLTSSTDTVPKTSSCIATAQAQTTTSQGLEACVTTACTVTAQASESSTFQEVSSTPNSLPELAFMSNTLPEHTGESNTYPVHTSTSNTIPDEASTSNSSPELALTSNTLLEFTGTSNTYPVQTSTSNTFSQQASMSNSSQELPLTSNTLLELTGTSNTYPVQTSTSNTFSQQASMSNSSPELALTSNNFPDNTGTSNTYTVLTSTSNTFSEEALTSNPSPEQDMTSNTGTSNTYAVLTSTSNTFPTQATTSQTAQATPLVTAQLAPSPTTQMPPSHTEQAPSLAQVFDSFPLSPMSPMSPAVEAFCHMALSCVSPTTQGNTLPLLPLPTTMPPTPEEPIDCDSMIATLIEAHHTYICSSTYMSKAYLLECQQRHYEVYQNKLAMFGPLSTLSHDQYMEIYEKTGMDVDNRQEMMTYFATHMENGIKKYISFVKLIPGFTDLNIEDQATLVKASRFEFWLWGTFLGYNMELMVACLPNGKCLHRSEMCRIWDEDFITAMFRFAQTLKKLPLLPDEFVIVKCICLTFADRSGLKEPAKVEQIQWRLIQCFLQQLKKNHKSDMGLYAKVIDRMMELRTLTEWNYKLARRMHLWPAFQQSPLLIEIISM